MRDDSQMATYRTRLDLLPLWEWQYRRAVDTVIRTPPQSNARRYAEHRALLLLRLIRLLAPRPHFWCTLARLPGRAMPAPPSGPCQPAAIRLWLADRRTRVAALQQQQLAGHRLLTAWESAELEATEVVLRECETDARACADQRRAA